MKQLLPSKMMLIVMALLASTIASVAQNRNQAPRFSNSDVMALIRSKSQDKDYQKYLLEDARKSHRMVEGVKSYKKLSRADVIAVKWDCFDDFPHDWGMVSYVFMDRLFKANKKK